MEYIKNAGYARVLFFLHQYHHLTTKNRRSFTAAAGKDEFFDYLNLRTLPKTVTQGVRGGCLYGLLFAFSKVLHVLVVELVLPL